MTEQQRERVRAAIIKWLGHSYDADDLYAGNPDYWNAELVAELVVAIEAALAGK